MAKDKFDKILKDAVKEAKKLPKWKKAFVEQVDRAHTGRKK